MSNQLISLWLLAMINEQSMSNRSPKILSSIDYSSMTSITHWCSSLLMDDPSITRRPLYCTRKTFLAFLYLFYFVCDSFICVTHFFLYLKFQLPMSRRKVLITNTMILRYLCNISLYPTLYFITKQLNSNQPVWKWN